ASAPRYGRNCRRSFREPTVAGFEWPYLYDAPDRFRDARGADFCDASYWHEMMQTVFADAELARRIEGAEALNARGCSAPGGPLLEVAGGCAIFAGADSPLSQAVGL